MNPDHTAELVGAMASRWWMLIARGAVAILFGVLAIVAPKTSLHTLLFLWGTYAVCDGVLSVLLASQRSIAGRPWSWLLCEGTVSLGVGILTLLSPDMPALVLLFLIALRAAFGGVAEMAAAIRLRHAIRDEWLLATSGLLSLGFGVTLLLYPGAGALAAAWFIGAHAVIFGALLIRLGLRVHHWRLVGPFAH
jgi:uncharacterized membrane protein HdeD (DUF308 family)